MLAAAEAARHQRPVALAALAVVEQEEPELATMLLMEQLTLEVVAVEQEMPQMLLGLLEALAALVLSSYATQHLISLSLCSTLLPSGLLLSA
jgi:hypothetical protein